ncbi:Aspartic protease [Grifola frondosa]|uniref:Aspartic protease n=1 Tax=Grifola frondosa TaxID=5627 RepID=A0A1C7MI41_GRIFR|nr:Aspartic protease [Grifola frondosa]
MDLGLLTTIVAAAALHQIWPAAMPSGPSASLLFFVLSGWAVQIPFRAELSSAPANPYPSSRSNLHSRDAIPFSNLYDVDYVANILVDGQSFEVQLDTGSSDLWIDTTDVTFSSETTDTHFTAGIRYLDGTVATGDILLSSVSLGQYMVHNQSFISAPGSNATFLSDKGILGIGPPSLSVLFNNLDGSPYDGTPFMNNVFQTYQNESSFYTFLLSRSEVGITDGGIFTIGELGSHNESISQAPKLSLLVDKIWMIAVDGAIINGQSITGNGIPPKLQSVIPPSGKLTAVFDTGTGAALAPPYYVDAMYKDIPGAQYSPDDQFYYVPCDSKVNVSVVVGTNEYPVHPIDTTVFYNFDDDGLPVCIGAWRYSTDSGQDFLLGDSFLRNVYSVFNFGSLARAEDGAPYLQILSVTNADQAWAEYDSLNAERIASARSSGASTPRVGALLLPTVMALFCTVTLLVT